MEENPLCPVVKVTKEDIKVAQQPWRMALIVKILGKGVGLRFLQYRLSKLWQPEVSMEVINLENDYFLVRLGDRRDIERAFFDGPWKIYDHYLIVQRWEPSIRRRVQKSCRLGVYSRTTY